MSNEDILFLWSLVFWLWYHAEFHRVYFVSYVTDDGFDNAVITTRHSIDSIQDIQRLETSLKLTHNLDAVVISDYKLMQYRFAGIFGLFKPKYARSE